MMRGIQSRQKRYVQVTALHREDGTVMPLSITWDDGRVFEIDEILDKRQASSLKVGGNGTRYLIRIGERETFLYDEGLRWFVEEKVRSW